jgi:acyl-CoA reductase-like NAD-dependent aldehyde dehydrogenase
MKSSKRACITYRCKAREGRARNQFETIRQSVGVRGLPFNFPAMVPMWFLPFAIVCGNTFVLKPSGAVPLTSDHLPHLKTSVCHPRSEPRLARTTR